MHRTALCKRVNALKIEEIFQENFISVASLLILCFIFHPYSASTKFTNTQNAQKRKKYETISNSISVPAALPLATNPQTAPSALPTTTAAATWTGTTSTSWSASVRSTGGRSRMMTSIFCSSLGMEGYG